MFGCWDLWLTATSILVAVLVLVNIGLFELNRRLQADVSARAQFIQQTGQLEALSREIVNAIATLAVRNNDAALRRILTQHGISLTGPASTEPAPSGATSGADVGGAARERTESNPR